MRFVRALGVAVLSLTLLTAADCDKDTVITPDRVHLTVSPATVALAVGQSSGITATVSGAPTNTVTFLSFNPEVASVAGSTGVVTCRAVGSTLISVTSVADPSAQTLVPVLCSQAPPAAPPAPQTLISVTGGPFTFTHRVNTTSCPQRVGTIRVVNTSNVPVETTVDGGHSALRLNFTQFTLNPGEVCDLTVDFTCGTQQSFTSTVTITARGGDATSARTVQVTGSIQR